MRDRMCRTFWRVDGGVLSGTWGCVCAFRSLVSYVLGLCLCVGLGWAFGYELLGGLL